MYSLSTANIGIRRRVFRLCQEHLIVSVTVQLTADRRHFVGAPLVEPVVALITIESCKQQSPTALAEGQREECLANVLMGDEGRKADNVQYPNTNLITIKSADVGVPRDRDLGVVLIHLAHVECQVAPLKGFSECVSQPHAGHHLN